MTTHVIVKQAGHHTKITTVDRYGGKEQRNSVIMPPKHVYDEKAGKSVENPKYSHDWEGYATDTRTIEVVDLQPDDPEVTGEKPAEKPAEDGA